MFERAKEALQIEADSILELIPRVDEHFGAALEMILHCPGRIIVTGMGKSGIIGRKIAATLASTGTPSFFLHPAEAIHGDLGMVTQGDVILAISNSGETGEVLHILPSIRRIGARIIAMVGKPESTLAKNADIVLDVGVKKEACPLGLAPTSSTTAPSLLAMPLPWSCCRPAILRKISLPSTIPAEAWAGSCSLRLGISCTKGMKIRWCRLT